MQAYDLPHYIDHLAARIGKPSLLFCLDSGCGNYDQLWLTTSLRGNAIGTLTVRVLTEGVHSATPRARALELPHRPQLAVARRGRSDRAYPLDELYVQIPPQRIEQARHAQRS